jgi:tRNA(Ile)-lysidine synthase
VTPVSDLSTRIAVTIREQQLFRPGDTLIIGLSGGADSTALLDLLRRLPGTPLRLIAAHLNHCLRGAESDADEEFCRRLAAQYQIPFVSRRVDVKAIADKGALNLEDAGRRARIALFDELLTTWQATAVVLAHHADDQAETVLMRLLRGSGMSGLAGMPYRNGRGYVRPLLDISRAEIEAHLIDRGLVWREDGSNLDRSFLRNRIRHELLPLLERYNPSIRAGLTTTATLLSAENELLDELTIQAAGQICHETAHGPSCCIHLLTEQPQALQRRIIRLILSRLRGNLEQFTFLHVDAVCRMVVSSRPNARINLPQGIIAVKEYDALVFRTGGEMTHQQAELPIPGPGVYQLPGGALLTVEVSQLPAHLDKTGSSTVYFDLDNVPFPWHVRTFLPGDRIQQNGMTGRKKVKAIFIDGKIPLAQRSRLPLLFCGDELIWLCGLRRSHRGRLDDGSSRIIKVGFSRPDGLCNRQLTCI